MKINERIKKRRLECGLSVIEVAAALNVSRATVYRYESEEIENMGIDKLVPLAEVLRTTPEYLMGWTDDQAEDDTLMILNRAAKKMTPEQREKLLNMAKLMFEEDFGEDE